MLLANTIISQENNTCQAKNNNKSKILSDKMSDGSERGWNMYKRLNMKLSYSYARLGGLSENEYKERCKEFRVDLGKIREEYADKHSDADMKSENEAVRKLKADYYKDNKYLIKADNARLCGDTLEFLREADTDKKYLKYGYFCKDRLCAMCGWRRSLRTFTDVSEIMNIAQRENPNLDTIFLTLTVKNIIGADLSATIDNMMRAWGLLLRKRRVERAVKGWFRSLEVTYQLTIDDYHPHLHCILLVDKDYFTSKDFITQEMWQKYWESSLGADLAIVYVEAYKNENFGIREQTKGGTGRSRSDHRGLDWVDYGLDMAEEYEHNEYAVKQLNLLAATANDDEFLIGTKTAEKKTADVKNKVLNIIEYLDKNSLKKQQKAFPLPRDKQNTDRIVEVLHKALFKRRLICLGGVMKDIAKRIKAKLEDGDLIHIDDVVVRPDVAMFFEVYKWDNDIKNYLLTVCREADERDYGKVTSKPLPREMVERTRKRGDDFVKNILNGSIGNRNSKETVILIQDNEKNRNRLKRLKRKAELRERLDNKKLEERIRQRAGNSCEIDMSFIDSLL